MTTTTTTMMMMTTTTSSTMAQTHKRMCVMSVAIRSAQLKNRKPKQQPKKNPLDLDWIALHWIMLVGVVSVVVDGWCCCCVKVCSFYVACCCRLSLARICWLFPFGVIFFSLPHPHTDRHPTEWADWWTEWLCVSLCLMWVAFVCWCATHIHMCLLYLHRWYFQATRCDWLFPIHKTLVTFLYQVNVTLLDMLLARCLVSRVNCEWDDMNAQQSSWRCGVVWCAA